MNGTIAHCHPYTRVLEINVTQIITAVQSCITKCFCKILNNRLTVYLDSNDLLCEEQGEK